MINKRRQSIVNAGRFILAYTSTIITFGIPIWICWDWYVGGPEKYIAYTWEIHLLFTEHTLLMGIILFMALIILIVLYVVLWRLIFPDYMRVLEESITGLEKYPPLKTPNYEGRVYWIKNYGISKRIAKWIGEEPGDPEINEVVIYCNMKGLLNIFVPTKSMTKIRGCTESDVERSSPWKYRIYERGHTINPDTNELRVVDGSMEMIGIDPKESKLRLSDSIKQHVLDARNVSQADVALAKEQLLGSTFTLPEDIKEGFPEYDGEKEK